MTCVRNVFFLCLILILTLSFTATAGTLADAIAAHRKGDYGTALTLFRQLAQKGDAGAQYNLGGYMYITGQGVVLDNVEAAKWFRLAATKGLARAQLIYGLMCASGERLPQDYTEAAKWFRLAAEQGEAGAQYSLGVAYVSGQGFPQNYVEAAKWFRLAASQGYADAQFRLGLAYFLGRGVPQNYVIAHVLLSLSAAQGYKGAEEQRNDLATNFMTRVQVAEAQRLAAQWPPANPDLRGQAQRGELCRRQELQNRNRHREQRFLFQAMARR